MSTTINKCLNRLSQMTTEELDLHNRRLRLQLAVTEWELAVSLLASHRQDLHQKLGHSSVTDYATKKLNLAPQKTMELVSTARAMERLPLLSERFRAGELSWCKVRELKRVATPETESVWIDFALEHNTHQIQRKVACSPKEWKRNQALNASLSGEPKASAQAVEEIVTKEDLLFHDQGATKLAEEPVAESLPAQKFIRVEFLLTPEQYAVYEEAESRVRARKNQRLPRAAVLAELARSELDRGASKERARFQVVLHTNEDGKAWFETQRGILPAPPELLEEALNPWWKEPLTADGRSLTSTWKSGRQDIPNSMQRAVFARAGNRCECCGCRGGRLEIHHLDAVSDGGENTLEKLRVLCKPCHALIHKMDFEVRADWARARELALRKRRPEPERSKST